MQSSLLIASLLLGCGAPLLNLSAAPQVRSGGKGDPQVEPGPATYDQALNRVFPTPQQSDFQRGKILSFWLRFQPGLDPDLGTDSQIKVTLVWGTGAVVEYSSTAQRVDTVLHNLSEKNPKAQLDEVLSKLAITRKTLKATPSQVLGWQRGLLRALSQVFSTLPAETKTVYASGTATITVDASSYDVWYSEGQMEFHYADSRSSDQSPFVKWADGFRAEIIAALKQSK